jgi:hypothetical protein
MKSLENISYNNNYRIQFYGKYEKEKKMIKCLMFVLLLTAQCFSADPTIEDLKKIPGLITRENISGGVDVYYKGRLIYRTTRNVFGGQNIRGKDGLATQTKPNVHGGHTFITPPTMREQSVKPNSYGGHSNRDIKSPSYERYQRSMPTSKYDSGRVQWGKATIPSYKRAGK